MELKQLYHTAKNELETIVPEEKSDFRLEQAEYNEKEGIWEIVVSFLVENENKKLHPISMLSDFPYERLYKKVKIDEKNQVLGFYIFNKNDFN